jgi:CBS domain-containing protein
MARLKISGMAIVDNSGAIVGMISEGLVRRHEDHSGRQARKACPKTGERGRANDP